MTYAASAGEIQKKRKAFLRKWRLRCKAVADCLEEAGSRLFTFTKLPASQWKSARTTNAIERLCVFRRGHQLERTSLVRPQDLHQERLICLAPEDTARKQLDRHLLAAGFVPRMLVEPQFSATVCQFALEGAGVGVANVLSYVSDGFEKLGLIARPLVPPVRFVMLQILPPQRVKSRLVDEFTVHLNRERIAILRACSRFHPEAQG
jgi:hypothetical protein